MSIIVGCDYSYGRPSPVALKAAGYHFAVRYLSGLRTGGQVSGKDLTVGEYHSLRAAGVEVALVWEVGSGNWQSGYAQGVADARAALKEIAYLGLPGTRRPVYFAIDSDAGARASTLAQATSYIRGAASVLGVTRTGVYGGYKVVKACLDMRACAWAWQTLAWSYGTWDPRAHLQQVGSKVVARQVVDVNHATVPDFGQWPEPASVKPTPPPVPSTPHPQPAPKPALKLSDLKFPRRSSSAVIANKALAAEGDLAQSKVRAYWSIAASNAFRRFKKAHLISDNRAAWTLLGKRHGFTVE